MNDGPDLNCAHCAGFLILEFELIFDDANVTADLDLSEL
jgi:hypothetical protein